MLFFVFVCTNLLTIIIVDLFVERERNGNFAVESRSRTDDSQVSDEHRTDAVSTNPAGASSSTDVIYLSIIFVMYLHFRSLKVGTASSRTSRMTYRVCALRTKSCSGS